MLAKNVQATRVHSYKHCVIVGVFREQARSYREWVKLFSLHLTIGR